MMRPLLACVAVFTIAIEAHAQPLPAYRGRLLGVYNAQTGDPIEGAEVIDVLNKNKSLTTATGTVTLAFLPDGGSMIRIQKIGFEPETNVIPITAVDTLPVTVMLKPLATTLPTVVTKETARKYTSPGLQAFEERRLRGLGRFISEATLRKNDSRTMTNLIREAGISVSCMKRFPYSCFAVSTRLVSKNAFGGGACPFDVYIDGNRVTDERRDLEKLYVNEIGGVEMYSGPASIPSEYNMTGSSCGVVLFWSRER